MKKLHRLLPKALLLLLVMVVFVQANAQKRLAPVAVTDFRMTISNDVQTGPRVLEFDIFMKDTDVAAAFEASIVQPGVYISKSCLGGGTPVISMVAGSSEMTSGLIPNSFAYQSINTSLGEIKIAARTAPGCGSGTFLSQSDPGTKFCRVRITNSVDFVASSQANLTWDFATAVPNLQTKVYYYNSGCTSTQITCNSSNCFNLNYTNVILNPPAPPTAFAVTGGGTYCEPGAGMPVGLANSQVGVTYTLYQGATPLTPTYTGTGAAIPMGTRPGTFVYSVTGAGPGGTTPMSNTVTVTMNTMPIITFGPLADVCVGGAPITLTATPTGGVYSGNAYLIPPDQFNPSTVGSYNITYNYADPITLCPAIPVTQPIVVKVCTPTWGGAVSTVWSNPANWLGGNVPAADGTAIIPDGCTFYPVIGDLETIHIGNLEVGNAVKSTLGGKMTVTGELIVGGNLTIKSTGSVDISAGGALTIDGNLSIVGTMLIENQGSMITNGSVSGTATIQRFINNNMAWHFLSSPVSAQPICNGVFAPTYPGTFPGNVDTWDFYNWLPGECDANLHWRNLRTPSGTPNNVDFNLLAFQDNRGYLCAYGAGWETTKNFVGTPNTADRDLPFYDVTNECSWALPGNPFPSAIAWSGVLLKENLITPTYYVWDDATQLYAYWQDATINDGNVNGNIPSMQAFFVKVLPPPAGGLHLNIPNAARVHDNNTDTWLKENATNKLALTISNGSSYKDNAYIMFAENASVGQDRRDIEKMFSMNTTTVPQIYTIINNDLKTSWNTMPYVNNGTTIPVGFVAPAEGNYSITAGNIGSFTSLTGLVLEDLELNVSQNLMLNPVYNFTATGKEDAGRFLLHFAGAIGMDQKEVSQINIYSNEKTVFISGAANAQVTISNLLGQEIVAQKLSNQSLNQVKVNALKGYYIVKVQNESSVKTAKVYIN